MIKNYKVLYACVAMKLLYKTASVHCILGTIGDIRFYNVFIRLYTVGHSNMDYMQSLNILINFNFNKKIMIKI